MLLVRWAASVAFADVRRFAALDRATPISVPQMLEAVLFVEAFATFR